MQELCVISTRFTKLMRGLRNSQNDMQQLENYLVLYCLLLSKTPDGKRIINAYFYRMSSNVNKIKSITRYSMHCIIENLSTGVKLLISCLE